MPSKRMVPDYADIDAFIKDDISRGGYGYAGEIVVALRAEIAELSDALTRMRKRYHAAIEEGMRFGALKDAEIALLKADFQNASDAADAYCVEIAALTEQRDAARHEAEWNGAAATDMQERAMRAQEQRDRAMKALQHCLGVLCEAGDLNNYRNLSDEELGKAWVAAAKEAAAALDTPSSPSLLETPEAT